MGGPRGLTDVTDVMEVRTAGRLLLGSSPLPMASRFSFTSPPASAASNDTSTACKELSQVVSHHKPDHRVTSICKSGRTW